MYEEEEEVEFPEVYIPEPWDSALAEECLDTFTRYTSALAKKLEDGTHLEEEQQEIEVELRIGSIDGDTGGFTPGVNKQLFEGMLRHLLTKVKRGAWQRSDGAGAVSIEESDTVDVSFDDGVRVSTRVLFVDKRLTKVKRVEIADVVSKRTLGRKKNFSVRNAANRKKQSFDMRLSVACEDALQPESIERSLHEDAAKAAIKDAYNVPKNEKILGGAPVLFAKDATNLILDIPLPADLLARGRLAAQDPLLADANKNKGRVSVALAGQLQWTLLEPQALPSLHSHADARFPNAEVKEDVPRAFVNRAGTVSYGGGRTWAASACQYVVFCEPRHVRCVTGRYAVVGEGKEGEGAAAAELRKSDAQIEHFRRKKRWSFKLGEGLQLDMTRTQQSLNPAGIYEEPHLFEIEVETVLKATPKQCFSAVRLTTDMVKHVADLVYGIKLPDPDISQSKIWQDSQVLDEKRAKTTRTVLKLASPVKGPEEEGAAGKKRKASQMEMPGTGTDQQQAGDFYNKLDRSSVSSRSDSMIYHMRCFNNFAKSVAIKEYIALAINASVRFRGKQSIAILDLACGKGADIGKFVRAVEDQGGNAAIERYVGSDIAKKSLEDAVERIHTGKRKLPFSVRFIAADLGSTPLSAGSAASGRGQESSDLSLLEQWDSATEKWSKRPPSQTLGNEESFDLVSIQFALHYMFQTEARADRFFSTVSHHLNKGGYFVATTVHAGAMIQQLMRAGPGENSFSLRDERDRESCNVRFDEGVRDRVLQAYKHGEDQDWLGLRYHFLLKDGVKDDAAAVSAPEWLVPIHELERIARRHDLRLVLYERLPSFVKKRVGPGEEQQAYNQLLERMNVLNIEGTLSSVEWQITSLYAVLALQKVDKSEPNMGKVYFELKSTIPHFDEIPADERSKMVSQRIAKTKS